MKFVGNSNEREWEEEMTIQRSWTIVNVNPVQDLSLDPLMEQLKSLFFHLDPKNPETRLSRVQD